MKAPSTGHCTGNRFFFQASRVDRMGGAGRGARVVPTEESKTAPLSQLADVFTSVVPVDHAADDPVNGALGPALADASARSHTEGQGYVSHPRESWSVRCRGCGERALPWGDASSHFTHFWDRCYSCDLLP